MNNMNISRFHTMSQTAEGAKSLEEEAVTTITAALCNISKEDLAAKIKYLKGELLEEAEHRVWKCVGPEDFYLVPMEDKDVRFLCLLFDSEKKLQETYGFKEYTLPEIIEAIRLAPLKR